MKLDCLGEGQNDDELRIAVTLEELGVWSETVGEGMIIALIQTLTPTVVYERREIHLHREREGGRVYIYIS